MLTRIRNAKTAEGTSVDLLIEEGTILRTEPAAGNAIPGELVIDAEGYVLLPCFVDAHNHPDKTVLGMDWFVNEIPNVLSARIDTERNYRIAHDLDPYAQACSLFDTVLAKGTLAVRSHVDVDTDIGLKGMEGVLRAREDYKDKLHTELVAFPQSGLVRRPGTRELMEEALKMGADLVGGLDPAAMDRDPVQSIKTIFDLAEKYDKKIDIHLHEPAALGAFSLSLIIERTLAAGMQGRVTVSHAFCLAAPDSGALMQKLSEAGISITTGGQAYIQTIPSLKQLRNAGVLTAGGNDNVRDIWSPYGTGDMLERTQFIAMRNGFRQDEELLVALDACTNKGAELLDLQGYGIAPGNAADFLLVKGRNAAEAIVTSPADRMVFRKGKMIAKDLALV